MIPRLETERLILREYRPEDFEAFASFMADPDVVRYLHGEPMARADAWRAFAAGIGHWALARLRRVGGGAQIRRRFHRPGRPLQSGRLAGLEVGWTLGKPYWHQGYALIRFSLLDNT